MTNKEWLDYLAHNAPDELAVWFDSEHVEHQERALDSDTESENSNTDVASGRYATAFKWLDRLNYGKGGVIGKSLCDTPEQGEVVMPLENWREYLETEPENADSREKLEADMREYFSHWIGGTSRTQAAIIDWLDRQAAITAHQWESYHNGMMREWMAKTVELQAQVDELTQIAESKRVSFADRIRFVNQIDELTAERDNLKANNEQLHTLAGEQAAKIDELQSALDAICANLSIIATGEPNVIADIAIETIEELIDECNTANRHCNEYRNKFGKCIDYADAIHALMDEGAA